MAQIGEYKILKQIGQGAFANVYKVKHKRYGYIRAVKILSDGEGHQIVIEDENDEGYQSLLKECKTLLKIGNGAHPNIVRINEPCIINQRAMVEMDFVQGKTLNRYVGATKFIPMREVNTFIRDIVGAMAFCHHDIYLFLLDPEEDKLDTNPKDAGEYKISHEKQLELIRKYRVIHNDLHSDNIIRRDYDRHFILLDFGLSIQNDKCVKTSRRRDGALEYKSPEKFNPKAYDIPLDYEPSSDVYSLGILIYEMLAGRPPFSLQELSANEITDAHLEATPPPIESLRKKAFEATHVGMEYEKDYPDWLETIVMKCLEKDPTKRYPDAKALLDDYDKHCKEDATDETNMTLGLNEKLEEARQSLEMAIKNEYELKNKLEKEKEEAKKKEEELRMDLEQKMMVLEKEKEEAKKKEEELQNELKMKGDALHRAEILLNKKNDKLNEQLREMSKENSQLKVKLEGKTPTTLETWLICIVAALLGMVVVLGYNTCTNTDVTEDNKQEIVIQP